MLYNISKSELEFLKMHLNELKACAGSAEFCTEINSESCKRCWDKWFEDKKIKEESKKSPYLS